MNGKFFPVLFVLSSTALVLTGCTSTNSETENQDGSGKTKKIVKQAGKMMLRRSPIVVLKAVK